MSASEQADLVKKIQVQCPECGEKDTEWMFSVGGWVSPVETWYGSCECKIDGFEEGLEALGIPEEEWYQW